MGSVAEFNALCKFLTEKKIALSGLVDSVFKGLESADEAFEKMKNGSQLGNCAVSSDLMRREISHFGCTRRQWEVVSTRGFLKSHETINFWAAINFKIKGALMPGYF